MIIEVDSKSDQDTFNLGYNIGKSLGPNSVVALYGDLGAGKTTFVKGVAHAVGGIDPSEVNSPTFTYLNIYEGLKNLYHFDVYRLESAQQFEQMGFDEYFVADGITCIEWADLIKAALPERRIDIHFQHMDDCRKIKIESAYEEINF